MKPEIRKLYQRIIRVTLAAALPLSALAGWIWDPWAALAVLSGSLLAGAGFLGTLLTHTDAMTRGGSIVPPIAVQLIKVTLTALAAYVLVRQRVELGLFFFAGYTVILIGIALDGIHKW